MLKKKDKNPSILFIAHSSARNGAPLVLYRLLKSISLQYPANIIFPAPGPIISDFEKIGLKTFILKKGNEFTQYNYWDIRKIKKTIKKTYANAVIANSIGSFRGIFAATKLRKPNLFYIHEILNPGKKKARNKNWIKALTLSTKAYCVSQASKSSIETLIPDFSSTVLSPGIDLTEFKKSFGSSNPLQKELGTPIDSVIVGTVGTVCPNKGTDYFLESAKLLSKDFSNIYFVVIGKHREKFKSYTKNLKDKVSSYGLKERFYFLGERTDIPELLGGMDIFVQPSLFEAYSIVNMEAMATGIPIIATRVGGNIEQIMNSHAGILIPEKNPVLLAKSIKHLLDDPEQRRYFGQNGQKYAREHFNIHVNAGIFKGAIEETIKL